MLIDMLWAPRSTGFEYVMKTRSEEYISKIIESKEFWSTVMILELYWEFKNWE